MRPLAFTGLHWPIFGAGRFLDRGFADRVAWPGMPSARAVTSPHGRPPSRRPARAVSNLQAVREDRLLTKAELARMAGISALTLARIERGQDCRVDTKRKILLALGLSPGDKARVFGGGTRRGAAGRRASRSRR